MVLIPDREATVKGRWKRTPAHPYSFYYARKVVRAARKKAGLPTHVTLAACRHGGLSELGPAEVTEQGGMSLSGHSTPEAFRIYQHHTETLRAIAARRRRVRIEVGGDPLEGEEKGEEERKRRKSRNAFRLPASRTTSQKR
jgi:hypothetical protein